MIIIGAGAAGLMCAIEAGRRGRSVIVLEKADKPAKKIRISGGGRCNFTNLRLGPENYLSQNPHFSKSALMRYSPADFIARMETRGIKYHEKTLGQLFCDGSAQEVIDMLLGDCRDAGVSLQTGIAVQDITRHDGQFRLKTTMGNFFASSLVIATGGPSVPKMGATGYGYEIARQFGLSIIEPRAALVPFTFDGPQLSHMKAMAGLSADVEVKCGRKSFREALLFTHRGLSGPAILQISSYWSKGNIITVNFMPDLDVYNVLVEARSLHPARTPIHVLSESLPKRLAQFLCQDAHVTARLADLSNAKLRLLAGIVNEWRIQPTGTEGFRTAEVTLGGVDTSALSSKTFEVKSVPGLYFIGEVVDVTGQLGGYNFQWAWSSGHAAGQYV